MNTSTTLPLPLIDCHVHVFDPVRFPDAPDAWYLPIGADRRPRPPRDRLGHSAAAVRLRRLSHPLSDCPRSSAGR